MGISRKLLEYFNALAKPTSRPCKKASFVMTVIVSTIWGGKVSIVVDRRISRRFSDNSVGVVDDDSNKLLVLQCHGALFAIAYTGIAVAHQTWMDCLIADRLAHRKLNLCLAQPGSSLLARPAHALIRELKINLNGALNTDKLSRVEHLEVLIQGWEYGKGRMIPFSCKLTRGPRQPNGNRYFELRYYPVAKFFRENPSGLWGETLGDDGGAIDQALDALKSTVGFTHDDVERHLRQAVEDRSRETDTISPSCVAVQLDPGVADGHVLFTYYPHEASSGGYPFVSPWVMTPRMISSPSLSTSAYSRQSKCGRYLLGGFSDGNTNLHVVTRLPIEHGMPRGQGAMSFRFQPRLKTP